MIIRNYKEVFPMTAYEVAEPVFTPEALVHNLRPYNRILSKIPLGALSTSPLEIRAPRAS